MRILESWEDHNRNRFAIVRHSRRDQKEYELKTFEAAWLDEGGELYSFGGSGEFFLADFDTLEEARDFLLKGMDGYDKNPAIWLDMLEV